MSWLQTFTGKKFFPLSPRPADIDIRDIAHSLSLQCRFNGHCSAFYSVADHSLRVAAILPPQLQLAGLLHDAAEAYLSDLPRPVKQQLPDFCSAEDRLLEIIFTHFHLSWPIPPEVWHADETLLATESRDLMTTPPESWNLAASPLLEKITPITPTEAESQFLSRFASPSNNFDL
ncbi:MAG TPA: hypothetical protein VFE58_13090 [Tepidisphaeraceae bacterium]|jgi:hypothetical protein|nr:hypothetical protein [Tepidisphaeraceae bacterium]